jgi:hypothetical protein
MQVQVILAKMGNGAMHDPLAVVGALHTALETLCKLTGRVDLANAEPGSNLRQISDIITDVVADLDNLQADIEDAVSGSVKLPTTDISNFYVGVGQQ